MAFGTEKMDLSVFAQSSIKNIYLLNFIGILANHTEPYAKQLILASMFPME